MSYALSARLSVITHTTHVTHTERHDMHLVQCGRARSCSTIAAPLRAANSAHPRIALCSEVADGGDGSGLRLCGTLLRLPELLSHLIELRLGLGLRGGCGGVGVFQRSRET
jgi:hypothetical protein